MTQASNQPPQEPASYWIGTSVTNQVEFIASYDDLGDPVYVDPTNVYFKYTPHGLSELALTYGVDAALVRVSAGIYTVVLDTTSQPTGRWKVRWVSTGSAPGAIERYFEVRKSMQASP